MVRFGKVQVRQLLSQQLQTAQEIQRKIWKSVHYDILEIYNSKMPELFDFSALKTLTWSDVQTGTREGVQNLKENLNQFVQGEGLAAVDTAVEWAKDAYRILEEEEVENYWGFLLLPVLVGWFVFSRYFPVVTAVFTRSTGKRIYVRANFEYDEVNTKFDNGILTWGTDFLLAGVMAYLGYRIIKAQENKKSKNLGRLGATLMFTYSLSTFVGAVCHLFLSNVRLMNTPVFRFLWRICVGTVAVAGGNIGSVATDLAKLSLSQPDDISVNIPIVPHYFWFSWSVFFFGVVFWGLFSMKQPACDIFLTGVTQTVPTFYLIVVLYSRKHWKSFGVSNTSRQVFLFGALANVPLLPGYDVFNFLNLPLGIINLILHTNLGFAWSSQGYAILRFRQGIASCKNLEEDQNVEEKADEISTF